MVDLKAPAFDTTTSNMTDNMTDKNTSFLVLPTELRLEVYRIVLEECLAEGFARDVAGLFLCCREVNQEMEAEFMERVRSLLRAKYKYECMGHEDKPLRLLVRPKLGKMMQEPELSVDLSNFDLRGDTEKAWEALSMVARCVQPAFASNWSVLTLSTASLCLEHSTGSMDIFNCFKGPRGRANFRENQKIDRLVLNCGSPHLPVDNMYLGDLFLMYWLHRAHFHWLDNSRNIVQAWISRLSEGHEPGWRLTLDFKEGLTPAKGSLWQIGEVGGEVGVHRLFDSMEDMPLDPDNPLDPDDFESERTMELKSFPGWISQTERIQQL